MAKMISAQAMQSKRRPRMISARPTLPIESGISWLQLGHRPTILKTNQLSSWLQKGHFINYLLAAILALPTCIVKATIYD